MTEVEKLKVKKTHSFLKGCKLRDLVSALKLNCDSKQTTFARHVGLVPVTDELAYDTPQIGRCRIMSLSKRASVLCLSSHLPSFVAT